MPNLRQPKAFTTMDMPGTTFMPYRVGICYHPRTIMVLCFSIRQRKPDIRNTAPGGYGQISWMTRSAVPSIRKVCGLFGLFTGTMRREASQKIKFIGGFHYGIHNNGQQQHLKAAYR